MSRFPEPVQQVIDLGYAIVPANAQKQPLVKWQQWQDKHQTDEDRADLPVGDLYAVITGALYDLVILDFDGLAVNNQAYPRKLSPNVVTGSGGWHVWFIPPAYPVKTCSAVRPGVDVRGEGGLAYFYGTSSKGTYQLKSTKLVSSDRFLDLLPERKEPAGGAPPGAWGGDGVGTPVALRILQSGVAEIATARVGERNTVMTRVGYNIGGLVGAGLLDPGTALIALLNAAGECGAENAYQVLSHQLAAGAEVPWSAEPKAGPDGRIWHPVSDRVPVKATADPHTSGTSTPVLPPPGWQVERLPVPYDALPPVLASLVSKGWEVSACPPEFLAAACLPALGSGLGGLVTLGLRQGWRIPPSLYVALVGEAGTAKSPALRRALAPIRAAESGAWQDANPSHRFIVDDVTPEKLVTLLQENERGLLVATDELKGFFGGMGQYKGDGIQGRDRQFYLSLWSGEQVVVDRIKRGSTFLATPTLSVIGGIQPGVFANLLDGEPDGMMERFLMVWGDSVADEWREDDIDQALLDAYAGLWNRLRDFGMQEHVIPLTAEGRRAWKSWYDSFHRQDPPPKLASMWNKVRTHVARIALIYAACDDGPCDAAHIDRAVTTVEWALSHLMHVLRVAASSSPDERRHVRNRDRLDQFLQDYYEEHGDLPTGSYVLRYGPPGSRRARERDVLLAELGVVLL